MSRNDDATDQPVGSERPTLAQVAIAMLARERPDILSLIVGGGWPSCLWATDADLTLMATAGGGLAAIDATPERIVGTSLYDYLGTSDPEFLPVAAHLRALRGERVSYEIEWRGRSFLAHVGPMAGRPGCLGAAVDVTKPRESPPGTYDLNVRMLERWIVTFRQRIRLLQAPDCPLSRDARNSELTATGCDLRTLAGACELLANEADKAVLGLTLGAGG